MHRGAGAAKDEAIIAVGVAVRVYAAQVDDIVRSNVGDGSVLNDKELAGLIGAEGQRLIQMRLQIRQTSALV
tara:strand:+ start:5948 stop:6163 length:216 start_codon:yes stop_codon:yes gene_type:complete